jgi:hypothetical protein
VIALRRKNVTRYLFRAWHGASGGAPETILNTKTAVVPQIFMPRIRSESERTLPSFYEIPENILYRMASDHYNTRHNIASWFSSWAASIHLVLCYTEYLKREHKTNTVHVAVIDTHGIEDQVLVWHVPQLLGYGIHEYLAFGRVMGNGYRAVALVDLEQHSLEKIFPGLKQLIDGVFGHGLRRSVFSASAQNVDIDKFYLYIINVIGRLFENQAFPVTPALACLRPRLWRSWRGAESEAPKDNREDIITVANELGLVSAPAGLFRESWLSVGMVDTMPLQTSDNGYI